VTPTFTDHVDLLDLHGRHAVVALNELTLDDHMPPRDEPVRALVTEHWATLEIWAWSLEHRGDHWSEREEPVAPTTRAALVADIWTQVHRLTTSLRAAGPGVDIDYFGRPGTTADVARLLAHEVITMAHRANLAAGRAAPALSADVARDGVDHLIGHWSDTGTGIAWQPSTLAISTTDTGDEWQISLPRDVSEAQGQFRIASPQAAAATVRGPAVDLLWWLHGHPVPEEVVSLSGGEDDIRDLKQTFLHPVEKPARRWFGRGAS